MSESRDPFIKLNFETQQNIISKRLREWIETENNEALLKAEISFDRLVKKEDGQCTLLDVAAAKKNTSFLSKMYQQFSANFHDEYLLHWKLLCLQPVDLEEFDKVNENHFIFMLNIVIANHDKSLLESLLNRYQDIKNKLNKDACLPSLIKHLPNNPLVAALECDNKEKFKLLFDHGAKFSHQLWMSAIYHNDVSWLEYLTTYCKPDFDFRYLESSPLILAIKHSKIEVIDFIIKHSKKINFENPLTSSEVNDINNIRLSNNPLHFAIKINREDVIQHLLKNNNEVDYSYLLFSLNHMGSITSREEKIIAERIFLSLLNNIFIVTHEKNSDLLLLAIELNEINIIKILFEKGVDRHLILKKDYISFITRGKELGKKGDTLLHVVAKNNENLIGHLINLGAATHIQNEQKLFPIDLVKELSLKSIFPSIHSFKFPFIFQELINYLDIKSALNLSRINKGIRKVFASITNFWEFYIKKDFLDPRNKYIAKQNSGDKLLAIKFNKENYIALSNKNTKAINPRMNSLFSLVKNGNVDVLKNKEIAFEELNNFDADDLSLIDWAHLTDNKILLDYFYTIRPRKGNFDLPFAIRCRQMDIWEDLLLKETIPEKMAAAMIVAIELNDINIFKKILNHALKAKSSILSLSLAANFKFKGGVTNVFQAAIYAGNEGICKLISETNPQGLKYHDFCYAVQMNNLKIVKLLRNAYQGTIERNLDLPSGNPSHPTQEINIIDIAASNNNLKLVKFLLAQGANPNLQGAYLIGLANRRTYTDADHYLFQNHYINFSPIFGLTPKILLSHVIRKGNHRLVEALLDGNTADILSSYLYVFADIMKLCYETEKKANKDLLASYNYIAEKLIDLSVKNNFNKYSNELLVWAVHFNKIDSAEKILNHGMTYSLKLNSNSGLLKTAALNNNNKMVLLLLQYHVPTNEEEFKLIQENRDINDAIKKSIIQSVLPTKTKNVTTTNQNKKIHNDLPTNIKLPLEIKIEEKHEIKQDPTILEKAKETAFNIISLKSKINDITNKFSLFSPRYPKSKVLKAAHALLNFIMNEDIKLETLTDYVGVFEYSTLHSIYKKCITLDQRTLLKNNYKNNENKITKNIHNVFEYKMFM